MSAEIAPARVREMLEAADRAGAIPVIHPDIARAYLEVCAERDRLREALKGIASGVGF